MSDPPDTHKRVAEMRRRKARVEQALTDLPMYEDHYGQFDKRIADVLARLDDIAPKEERPVIKPRFDWTWNVSNLIVLGGMFVSVVFTVVLAFGAVKDYQATQEHKFDELISGLKQVQTEEIQNRTDIESDRKATSERVLLYAPQIEAAKQANLMQDKRIDGIVDSTRTLQGMVGELLKAVSSTHEDVAILKTRVDMMLNTRGQGPHGDAAPTPKEQVGIR